MSEALALPERQLLKVNEACRLLAECESLNEAKELRDQAASIQHYLGKRTTEAMNAAEIKLRAERRLGQLIPEQIEGPEKGRRKKVSHRVILPELGISLMQSSRWQAVARVPDEGFEGYITERRAVGGAITTAGVLRLLLVEAHDTESCDTEEGACGPVTAPDRLLHTLVILRDLYLVKDYEPDPILDACKKKDLKDLRMKLAAVAEWVQSLQTAINRRLQ